MKKLKELTKKVFVTLYKTSISHIAYSFIAAAVSFVSVWLDNGIVNELEDIKDIIN